MEELNRNRNRRMQRLDASEINSLSMTNTDEIEEAKEKVDKRQEKIAQRKADLEANSYSYKAAKIIQKTFDQYFLDPILTSVRRKKTKNETISQTTLTT